MASQQLVEKTIGRLWTIRQYSVNRTNATEMLIIQLIRLESSDKLLNLSYLKLSSRKNVNGIRAEMQNKVGASGLAALNQAWTDFHF